MWKLIWVFSDFTSYIDLLNYFTGISNVKSREDLVMSGSDSSDPFSNVPYKKPGKP